MIERLVGASRASARVILIRAEPPAETIRWLFGKVPQLEVLGRELQQAA